VDYSKDVAAHITFIMELHTLPLSHDDHHSANLNAITSISTPTATTSRTTTTSTTTTTAATAAAANNQHE